MEAQWVSDFKENCLYRIDESARMLAICIEMTGEDHFWSRPNPASNSIGTLLLHLSGNIGQYAISSLGGTPDTRQRDLEFRENPGIDPQTVWNSFLEVLELARAAVQRATEGELLRKRQVQGYYFSGMGVAIHVVEHLSYHTGQIAWMVKARENSALGFYDGMDLNVKNE